MAKNPQPPLLIPKDSGSPIYYSWGTQVCLHCPLAPEHCEESEIIRTNVRQLPVCLISFCTYHRVSLAEADRLAEMTLARGMSARAFKRAVLLTAERQQFIQSIKDRRRKNGGSTDIPGGSVASAAQCMVDNAARCHSGAAG